MKTIKFEAEAEKAYGKSLDSPIKYAGEYTAYENVGEVRSANDMPSDTEVIKWRNTERKSKSRQAALTAALDAAGIIKPTLENDEQLRLREMFKVLMSSKRYTEEQARDLASKTLNIEWADDSE